MIRGTTPTFIFDLPFEMATVSDVRVIFAQNNRSIVVKSLTDCEIQEKQVSVTLTQEESLKFICGIAIQIQMKVLLNGDTVTASNIRVISCDMVLSDEVF